MERKKKVVDASVMVKIFAEEEDSDKASKLLEEHIHGNVTLMAPELIFLETLNALRYKKFNQESLENANNDLFEFRLETVPINKKLLNKSIELSVKYGLSIYDSLYAALAEFTNSGLITADDKLSKTP